MSFPKKWWKHDPWIVSDTHFYHARIVEFTNKDGSPLRPWDNHVTMTEDMIRLWNEVVSPDDYLIHLGDIAFGGEEMFHNVMPRLNGIKILVKGNHDLRTMEEYLMYFEDVHSLLELPKKAILTHIPVHPSNLERFGLNLHGHLHSNLVLDNHNAPDKRYVNCCVEHTEFKPIKLEQLLS